MVSKKEIGKLKGVVLKQALNKLENELNQGLSNCKSLKDYQEMLYAKIKMLENSGYNIGRWDYDSEKEIWGGPSYMDKSKEDELVLKSWFKKGIKIDYNNFYFWPEFDE
jgi:Mn-containing catalase